MENELYQACFLKRPTDFQVDQLAQLVNDKDCPNLLTVDLIENLTPLELLCRRNNSHTLKKCIQIIIQKLKNGSNNDELLDGTWALDAVCRNYSEHDDLLDIVRILIKNTNINFNRPGLRLQRICQDLIWKLEMDTLGSLHFMMGVLIEKRFLMTDFNECDFHRPDFKIIEIVERFLHNRLKGGFPAVNYHHKPAAMSSTEELYATIGQKNLLLMLPRLEKPF